MSAIYGGIVGDIERDIWRCRVRKSPKQKETSDEEESKDEEEEDEHVALVGLRPSPEVLGKVGIFHVGVPRWVSRAPVTWILRQGIFVVVVGIEVDMIGEDFLGKKIQDNNLQDYNLQDYKQRSPKNVEDIKHNS